MKLVFIYGPPAVGKLTTGRALQRLTGFRLFHNHLTVDAVTSVFPEFGPVRTELLEKSRILILEAAARERRNTIFTYAYSGAVDDEWVGSVVRAVESHGGAMCFVQLFAPPSVLVKHVVSEERRAMGKFSEPGELLADLADRDHYAMFDHPNTLTLDTGENSAEENARSIVDRFGLPTGGT